MWQKEDGENTDVETMLLMMLSATVSSQTQNDYNDKLD